MDESENNKLHTWCEGDIDREKFLPRRLYCNGCKKPLATFDVAHGPFAINNSVGFYFCDACCREVSCRKCAEQRAKTPHMLQYENETGKSSMTVVAGFGPTNAYLQWLESKIPFEDMPTMIEFVDWLYCESCGCGTEHRCYGNPTRVTGQDFQECLVCHLRTKEKVS